MINIFLHLITDIFRIPYTICTFLIPPSTNTLYYMLQRSLRLLLQWYIPDNSKVDAHLHQLGYTDNTVIL